MKHTTLKARSQESLAQPVKFPGEVAGETQGLG